MKKLLLAVSVSAVFSGSVFSEDLTFDSASVIAEVQNCGGALTCGTTGEFALAAYRASEANIAAEDGVVAATAAQATADTAAAAAVTALAALDDTATAAQIAAAEALVTSTATAATTAAATTASAAAVSRQSPATLPPKSLTTTLAPRRANS